MFSIKNFTVKKRGLLTVRSNGGEFNSDFSEQAKYALISLENKLEHQRSSLDGVASITIYLDNPNNRQVFNLIWGEFFESKKTPTKKVLIQSELSNKKINIEIVATALMHDPVNIE